MKHRSGYILSQGLCQTAHTALSLDCLLDLRVFSATIWLAKKYVALKSYSQTGLAGVPIFFSPKRAIFLFSCTLQVNLEGIIQGVLPE
ncbi:MAG: hypothetical protein OHK0023_03990 [Anaerolineae bacterium]